MSQQIVELNCPGCGEPWNTSMKECPCCRRPVIITTFNSVYSMPMPEVNKYANAYRKALSDNPDNLELNHSLGMCYLKLKLYDKAISSFEKAMEDNFDNSETFFYAAICLLQGKKAYLTPRITIDKAEEYINAALMIEPKGIYYYLWAYIRYDHHFRKSYNAVPNYQDLLIQAQSAGLSPTDVDELFGILSVNRPDCI